MRSAELQLGRTFALAFEHGDDFYTALDAFCRAHEVRQGYIPMFVAGLEEVDLVGTCEKLDDPKAPVWSKVQLRNVEAVGAGTLAYNDTTGAVHPHIHVSVGSKELSALGHTSHLLNAKIQFLVEMVIVEVAAPVMNRLPNPDLFDVPLLYFATHGSSTRHNTGYGK